MSLSIFLCIFINAALLHSRQYYIKEGEVPSYLYHKFENVTEEMFPSFLSIKVAFSRITGTLLYSIDKNMNQVIVTMRDDLHDDTRYGVQVEVNTQLIIVSLSKLCGLEGSLFDERMVMTLGLKITNENIILICNGGDLKRFSNEKVGRYHDNYPILYSPNHSTNDNEVCVSCSDVCTCLPRTKTMNEAHMWLVNHPIMGDLYPNRDQMYGCIFNVFYDYRPLHFTNVSSNIGETCKVACRNNMCNGGECFVIYSEEPICNCTMAFLNGRLCNDGMARMNFHTVSQLFVYKMFKLSWKSKENSLLQLINKDIRISIGRRDFKLYFEYNFYNNSRKTVQVTLSDQYVPNIESICIVYFFKDTINIRTYTNYKWNSTWIPSIYDIRETLIETMIFTSGEGTMDFVFKKYPELLWMHPDFINKIEHIDVESNATKIAISVLIPVGVMSLSIGLYFLIRNRRDRDRKYINDCKDRIGWKIVFKDQKNSRHEWLKYIVKDIGPNTVAESILERMHILICDSIDKEPFLRDIIILFIHTRIFVLPSIMEPGETESSVADNKSIQKLISLITPKVYEYLVHYQKYLLHCMMDFIKEINVIHDDDIQPLVNAVVSFVGRYSSKCEYKYDGNVAFMKPYLHKDNPMIIWAAVIMSQHEDKYEYINIMKDYCYEASNKEEITNDTKLVYYAMLRGVSRNKNITYKFADEDYKLICAIFRFLESDIPQYINRFILEFIPSMFTDAWLNEVRESLRVDHTIWIDCFATILTPGLQYDDIDRVLLPLLDKLFVYIHLGDIFPKIVDIIMIHLAEYTILSSRIIDSYMKYWCLGNISEKIRLATSIIIANNMKEYGSHKFDNEFDDVHRYLSNIIDKTKQDSSENYLGFKINTINNAFERIGLR